MSTDKQLIVSNRFSFLAAGFGIAAWAPMIPLIKERYALDDHSLGLLLLCVGIGSMISMPTSGYLCSRIGCRKLVVIAGVILGALLTSIALLNNVFLTAVLLILFGMSAVTLDVVSNINAALVEAITKRNIMSGLHGLYSVGGFFASLTVTTILTMHLGITVAAIYSLICLWLCVLWGCRHLVDDVHVIEDKPSSANQNSANQNTANQNVENQNVENQNAENANAASQSVEEQRTKKSTLEQTAKAPSQNSTLRYYTHPLVLCIGLMCFIMFMTEGSILDWSGVFLTQERSIPLEYAGYGYAAFAIMMTCFRLLGDKIIARFGRRKVLLLGTLSIVCGYLVAVGIPHVVAALLGFALIGVGASNVVPQLVSVTAKIKEVPVHISVTIVNAIGFTGMLCGPALIGFLSQAISLPYTYLCQAACVLLVTVMIFKLLRPKSEAKD